MVQIKRNNIRNSIPTKDNFISHMVQIKLRQVLQQQYRLQLYIPHGSDKTLSQVSTLPAINAFISHMVQIKLILPPFLRICHEILYIPHGSDKTSHGKEFY